MRLIPPKHHIVHVIINELHDSEELTRVLGTEVVEYAAPTAASDVLAVPQVVSGEARDRWSEVQGTDKEGVAHAIVAEGTTEIGRWAFYGSRSLVSVTIPGSVTAIEDSAFYCCSSLVSVAIPGSVTAIGDWAFDGCTSLASVTIPGSVTAIGYCAFGGCSSLASVSLPAATTLGSFAFPSATVVTRRG